jgi:hypothetical protein
LTTLSKDQQVSSQLTRVPRRLLSPDIPGSAFHATKAPAHEGKSASSQIHFPPSSHHQRCSFAGSTKPWGQHRLVETSELGHILFLRTGQVQPRSSNRSKHRERALEKGRRDWYLFPRNMCGSLSCKSWS